MTTKKQRAVMAVDRVMMLSFSKSKPYDIRRHSTDREWKRFCEGRDLALKAVQDEVRGVMGDEV